MKNLEKRIWISQTHTIGQWINESIKNHSKKTAIVDGRTHITYMMGFIVRETKQFLMNTANMKLLGVLWIR